MNKFALIRKEAVEAVPAVDAADFSNQVLEVLVNQLGHKMAEARKMIADAMARNRSITTPEGLFEEIYRGEENS